MRCLLLTSVAMVAGFIAVASAETPVTPSVALPGHVAATQVPGAGTTSIKRTVYLDHVVLEELKKSKPEHYARAQSVMAAASELCAPNAARMWQALSVSNGDCSSMALKTSYPPKRQIGFQIDDTWYIALVTVTDAPALQVAPPEKFIPASTDAPVVIDRAQ